MNAPGNDSHDQQNYADCGCHRNHEKLRRRFLNFRDCFFCDFPRLYFWLLRRSILEHRSVHRIDRAVSFAGGGGGGM